MFDSKRTRSLMFSLVLLAFVVPSVVMQADVTVPATAVCLIGDHSGISDTDAQTSAMLVRNCANTAYRSAILYTRCPPQQAFIMLSFAGWERKSLCV